MADKVVVTYDELNKAKRKLEGVKQVLDEFSDVAEDEIAMGDRLVADAYDSYVRRLKGASSKYSKKAGDFASMLENVISQFEDLDGQLGQRIEQASESAKK